jgi:hypothetical protein
VDIPDVLVNEYPVTVPAAVVVRVTAAAVVGIKDPPKFKERVEDVADV